MTGKQLKLFEKEMMSLGQIPVGLLKLSDIYQRSPTATNKDRHKTQLEIHYTTCNFCHGTRLAYILTS